ncbi:MAG: site-specific DNA-methyltransferase [Gemmatimonadetes bacterium]|nr:MAG: site-specific DNA-methyltransferase [Gemmatimonadota bacterium]
MKRRAPRNRTLTCTVEELATFSQMLLRVHNRVNVADIEGRIINNDLFEVAHNLPDNFVDLLILDPPYNLSKNYNGHLFKEQEHAEYQHWFRNMVYSIRHILKPEATIYVCSDWKTSLIVAPILNELFIIQNRITWEREKGRGAKRNWKNNTEDIWFCTLSKEYYFNVDAVKLKRRVIAPYRTQDGKPKDWIESDSGNYRLTHPSNIWTDISVPFWSMPENTDHPTQKPEKLIAKLVLASSKEGDFIFDPFLGSGTTCVVAKKLNRRFSGVELNKEYCCWAQKRLELAETDQTIQGYAGGVFWERNTLSDQLKQNFPPQIRVTQEI